MKKLFLLFCVYLSVIYGICTGFGVEGYQGFVVIVAVFFFLYWSVLSSDLFHNNQQLRWIQYVQYCGLAGYVLYEGESCLRGGKVLANRLFDIVNTTFHRDFTYFADANEKTGQSDMIIFVVIVLLLYSGILLLSRRRCGSVVLYTMPVMVMILILAPRAVHGDFFLYFAGIIGLYYMEHHKPKCAMIGFTLLVLLAIIFEVYPSTELFGQKMNSIRQGSLVVMEYANNIVRGEKSVFTLNFGDLKQEAVRRHDTGVKIRVTLDSVEDPFYLRGYVGRDYASGKWRKDETAMRGEDEVTWLWDYEVMEELEQRDRSSISSTGKNMTIQYMSEDEKMDLIPYFIPASEANEEEEIRNSKKQQIPYVSVESFDELLDIRVPEYDEALSRKFYAREQEARENAKKHYLSIPDNLQEEIQKMRKEFFQRGDSLRQTKKNIRSYLRSRYTYTSSVVDTPKGEDPTLYFLQKSQRGYCSQYASAAVFMFRSCGIPARYVEGYVLKEEDFRDGTVTGGKMVVNMEEENAYAWVEVYADGVGWVPVDVVPGNTLVAASDAREIELPSLPKLTMSTGELVLGGIKLFGFIIFLIILRVFLVSAWYHYQKQRMGRRERILHYADTWERYSMEKEAEIGQIIQCARYSDHEMMQEEEDKVYVAAKKVRDEYRQKLPAYMNLFDVFIACRDIL